jgi:hemoglobin
MLRGLLSVGLALAMAASTSAATQEASAKAPSLYKRLGGYDALAAVTDDFIGRMVADPRLSRFFVGHAKESLDRIRQLIVDQLCNVTGGPCLYIGLDMKTAHEGLGIREKDWGPR